MQHVPHLQQFCGSYTRPLILQLVDFPFSSGPEAVPAGALSPSAVEAFKGRFADAKIFIDDVEDDYEDDYEEDYEEDLFDMIQHDADRNDDRSWFGTPDYPDYDSDYDS